MSLLVLSGNDVDVLTSSFLPEDLRLLMAQVFARLSANSALKFPGQQDMGVYMPPRIIIPTKNHTTLFMPARIGSSAQPQTLLSSPSDIDGTTIKVVSVPNKSDPRGLPGTTLVLDEDTGGIKAVVNARRLTALRNAAGSLLSTSLVGPLKPRTLVTFGAGQQIESHIDLHLRHFASITQCSIVNRTLNDRAISLKDRMAEKFGQVEISLLASTPASMTRQNSDDVPNVESCVRSADIIICATSSTDPLFPSAWVKTGAHIILIGSYKPTMHEIDTALLLRSLTLSPDRDGGHSPPWLIVDSRDACLHEAGEIIDAQISPERMTEIGELIPTVLGGGTLDVPSYYRLLDSRRPDGGVSKGRGFDGPVTIFKSVGIGLQDVAIASAIVNKALSLGAGKIGTLIKNYDV